MNKSYGLSIQGYPAALVYSRPRTRRWRCRVRRAAGLTRGIEYQRLGPRLSYFVSSSELWELSSTSHRLSVYVSFRGLHRIQYLSPCCADYSPRPLWVDVDRQRLEVGVSSSQGSRVLHLPPNVDTFLSPRHALSQKFRFSPGDHRFYS